MEIKRITRRDFIVAAGISAAGAVLAACGKGENVDPQSTIDEAVRETFAALDQNNLSPQDTKTLIGASQSPPASKTPERTFTPSKIAATPTETSTPTPNSTEEIRSLWNTSDKQNWQTVQFADKGDSVSLQNPDIEWIVKIPGDNYYALIDALDQDGNPHQIFLENPNCEKDQLQQNGLLLDAKNIEVGDQNIAIAAWQIKPGLRPISNLDADVAVSFSLGTPPLLTSNSFTLTTSNDKGTPISNSYSCPKESSIFDTPKEFVNTVLIPLLQKAYKALKDVAD